MHATNLISVVDDDESVRDSTRTLLRSMGYKVATFASSELFLQSETLTRTGCLILDMRMPGMGGLELQSKLNASHCHVPIIFVTAHGDGASRQSAMNAGASDFFQKPFAAGELLGAIQIALSSRTAL